MMNEKPLYPGPCPKCGAALLACSPSGNGAAACDECHTWWEDIMIDEENEEN